MTIHKWAGLFSGLFLLLIAFSGTILVFHKEIDQWQFEKYLEVSENTGKINLDRAIQTAWKRWPEREVRVRHFNWENPAKAIELDVRKGQERHLLFVHPSSGRLLKEVSADDSISRWLLKFHYSLHAGTPGIIFVTITGLLFIVAIVTGIMVYRKGIIKVFSGRDKIITKNKYALFSSLHRVVGVWALIFNLMMAVTGFLLALTISSSRLQSGGTQPVQYETTIKTNLNKGVAKLRQEYPDFYPDYLRMPPTPDKPARVYGYSTSSGKIWGRYANSAKIDVKTGEIISLTYARDLPFASKFNALVISLHFGSYGGWVVKIIYVLLGLSPSLLSITGFWLWWKKRKP